MSTLRSFQRELFQLLANSQKKLGKKPKFSEMSSYLECNQSLKTRVVSHIASICITQQLLHDTLLGIKMNKIRVIEMGETSFESFETRA